MWSYLETVNDSIFLRRYPALYWFTAVAASLTKIGKWIYWCLSKTHCQCQWWWWSWCQNVRPDIVRGQHTVCQYRPELSFFVLRAQSSTVRVGRKWKTVGWWHSRVRVFLLPALWLICGGGDASVIALAELGAAGVDSPHLETNIPTLLLGTGHRAPGRQLF